MSNNATSRPARRGEARHWLDAHLTRFEAGESMGIDACVPWPFSTNGGSGGKYPQIKIDGALVRVNRYICERLTGQQLAAHELVRHWCDEPRCVNPWHLEIGSHTDNMRDMRERARQAAGDRNGRARLSPADVEHIRALARDHDLRGNMSYVARCYGVSPTTIALILAGRIWRDSDTIPPPST